MVSLQKWRTTIVIIGRSVEKDDFLFHGFPADGALCDLVCAELACPVATQEHAVLAPVHAHLALCLYYG